MNASGCKFMAEPSSSGEVSGESPTHQPDSRLSESPHVVRRKISAPNADGSIFVDPAASQLPALIADNIARRAAYDFDVQGRSLTDLGGLARRELLDAAIEYTSSYRNIDTLAAASRDADRLFLAGHQPQMFHPGVWVKNFALGKLARSAGAAAINLVIDSDAVKSTTIGLPTGSREHPHLEQVPFDQRSVGIPFEDRPVRDMAMFESFGRRVQEELATFVSDPLVRTYWPSVIERYRATNRLGASLAQARHQLEGEWGLETLELPQSRVCQTEAFAWFAAHVLAHLPRFWDVYNDAVHEYRRVYRIRSAVHPVPDLESNDGWLEAPFWLWTADKPTRRRLFARRRGDEIVVTDRDGLEFVLNLSSDGDATTAVEQLRELASRGVRLRTRALLTTLFARFVACDLFLHGIGGGKYDELTDVIAARFFGLTLPRYVVLSGTLRLPIERHGTRDADLRTMQQRLREYEFHPERYLDGKLADAAPIVDRKAKWVATSPTRENARERCRAIRECNSELQSFVESQRRELLGARDAVRERLASERVLGRRDFSFCLFPSTNLRKFLLEFRALDF